MGITRKGFLKLGTFLGAGSILPKWAKRFLLLPKEEEPLSAGDESWASGVCGLCPAGCGLRVRLMDGRPVGVSGLSEHPINQGGLCPKGAAGLQELYHPDRIRRPLIRNKKGSDRFTEISYEEAFGEIEKRISGAISKPPLKKFSALTARRIWDVHLSALTDLAASLGGEAHFLQFPFSDPPLEATRRMQGASNVRCSLNGIRLLVSFGLDWLQAHPSPVEAQRAFSLLRQGEGPRAHIVQIEPRFSVSAAKSNSWIPLRPGTEGLLALGLARHLILQGTYDRDFVGASTSGFEDFRRSLSAFTPGEVSRATGVTEKEFRLLAMKLFRLRPSAILTRRGSLLNQMAVHALNALLGNIGPSRAFCAVSSSVPIPLNEDFGNSPEILLVDRVNPLFLEPRRWKPVFEKTPCIITVSSHMTETAKASDIVLPCATPLEEPHISCHIMLGGKMILNGSPPVVEPLDETLPAAEIFLRMIKIETASSYKNNFNSYLQSQIQRWNARNLMEPDSAMRWREIPTQALPPKFDFSPLTKIIPKIIPLAGKKDDFPLVLYPFVPLSFSFGEGAHLPYLQSVAGPQTGTMWHTWAEIHPETAKRFGVSDGENLWIESESGRIKAKAKLTSSAMPDVVSLPVGLGHTAFGRWAEGIGENPMRISDFSGARARIVRI